MTEAEHKELMELLENDPPGYARKLLGYMTDSAEANPNFHASKVRRAIMALTLEERVDYLVTAMVPLIMSLGEAIVAHEEEAAGQAMMERDMAEAEGRLPS